MAHTSSARDFQTLYSHADKLSAQGNHKAAAEALEDLLKEQESSLPGPNDALCAMGMLADEKSMLGDYAGAEAIYQNQLAAQGQLNGPDSTWAIMYNLCGILVKQGESIQAETMLRRLLPLPQGSEKNANQEIFAQQELETIRLLKDSMEKV